MDAPTVPLIVPASRLCLARVLLSLMLGATAVAVNAATATDVASSAAAIGGEEAQPGCRPPGATLTLAATRLLAMQCNAELRAARRAVQASEADIRIAAQRPNPVLSLGVQNINPHAGVGAGGWRGKTVDSIARVDQVIETANKAELRVDAARAANAAAGEQVQAVAAQQTATVEQAFYEAAVSQQRVAVLTETLALYARTEQANQARLKAGDIARADLTKLRLDALRAQADLREARADHLRDMAELAQRIGIPGTLEDTALSVEWPDAGQDVAAFDQALLQSRPDVVAAQARLRAAAAARDLARAGRVPDVTVGAQAEHYPVSATNDQGSGNSFGVFITIPLHVRHSHGGEAARAEVDYYAALDERNRVLLAAGNEVARLRAALDAARQSWLQMRDAVLPSAERVAADAEFAYGKGASGVLDLLDARRALRQTRLDAAQAQGNYAKALSAYLAAIRLSSTAAPDAATAP
ncbi:cobalt-zinc-cadmium efflux system outer membrane protein [Cupriavidus gilardii J11]|uniref:Cobalt-zinc-cadmium efflux system outer membrane protein n=1 Tax=Cupriavidus gilardii J11 TaxID=936133 RepID=A0A562BQ53_9BURK|nr:cobalt-zinc-cadmium efflux system outer membrane protein [Cupriavidus gilardii J11]